jgi:L-serine deaminase
MFTEHNLGLTCDPIDGLVQVPCIVSGNCSCFLYSYIAPLRNGTAWEVRARTRTHHTPFIDLDPLPSAVKAITAAQLSMASDGVYAVTLDEVCIPFLFLDRVVEFPLYGQAIEAMRVTAADMSHKYKETSLSVSNPMKAH